MPKASTKAKNKYNKKAYDRWTMTAPKGKKEEYDIEAQKAGYTSRNKFILEAIEEKIKRRKENV